MVVYPRIGNKKLVFSEIWQDMKMSEVTAAEGRLLVKKLFVVALH